MKTKSNIKNKVEFICNGYDFGGLRRSGQMSYAFTLSYPSSNWTSSVGSWSCTAYSQTAHNNCACDYLAPRTRGDQGPPLALGRLQSVLSRMSNYFISVLFYCEEEWKMLLLLPSLVSNFALNDNNTKKGCQKRLTYQHLKGAFCCKPGGRSDQILGTSGAS